MFFFYFSIVFLRVSKNSFHLFNKCPDVIQLHIFQFVHIYELKTIIKLVSKSTNKLSKNHLFFIYVIMQNK